MGSSKDRTMTKYLISFPGSAMDISDEDMAAVGEAAHAVMREAKDTGVFAFGGGINGDVAPLMVAADGADTNETYQQTKEFDGGFCVLELPSREAAVQWAAKIPKPAAARRNSASSGTTPRADWRGRSPMRTRRSFLQLPSRSRTRRATPAAAWRCALPNHPMNPPGVSILGRRVVARVSGH
jgi:hypothetical protein